MARRLKPSTPEYFLKRIAHEGKTSADCWEWQGSVNYAGYGRLLWNGQRVMAHRVMALLAERIPDIDAPEFVAQTCKNRKCCNPDHLAVK